MAVWVGPVGSEWAGWKPEVLAQVATVAPGDGGHPPALGEPAPLCPRRHGYIKKTQNYLKKHKIGFGERLK